MHSQISGIVDQVVFHNEENGFSVLRISSSRNDLITVVGQVPAPHEGEILNASGTWKQDPRFGRQFSAESIRITQPDTQEGIMRFLSSGLIKGIGERFAERLVQAFGRDIFKIIENHPDRLLTVEGIGKGRRDLIVSSWQDQKGIQDVMVFLHSHGISPSRAFRIYKRYGKRAIETVSTNPYCLTDDIHGVGFKTADQIAMRVGIPRESQERARAGIHFALTEMSREGHCACCRETLLDRSADLLGIPTSVVTEALDAEISEKGLSCQQMAEGKFIYLPPLHHAEVSTSDILKSLLRGGNPLKTILVEKAIEWVSERHGISLAPQQQQAIRAAVSEKVLIITGGPGVGKTTLIRSITDIFSAKNKMCLLCAPTGRAAQRLSEATEKEAKTIHRLLEFDPAFGTFKRNRYHPLVCDILIVDEISMVDIQLISHLLRALPESAVLILVGDSDQLPSVGPGNVLADLIASDRIPAVRLTEIFRQASESRIITNAHSINQGELPDLSQPEGYSDFFFVEAATPETVMSTILNLVSKRIPERFKMDPITDIQVITPMNRSLLGTQSINNELQKVLNPGESVEVTRHGSSFRVRDKVMQIVNNYDKNVFNGDIGQVTRIDADAREMTVRFSGQEIPYPFNELDEIVLAYACTIHKSQGSEFPAVVIPIHTQHYVMLQRNLIYTAITRSRKLVVMVGSRKAMQIAVQRADSRQRITFLKERLREGL